MPRLLKISKVKGKTMTIHLVVLKPFAGFKRGDAITDKGAIAKILSGPEAGFVVRAAAKGE
jgi:hypothetical protein